MTRVKLTEVSKRYGRTRALVCINLELYSGAITALVGPNGAGKSTLMRVLCGEEERDSGLIDVDGHEVPEMRERVALVHQEPQVWLNLTVAENLMVGREPARFGRPRAGAAAVDAMRRLAIDQFADVELHECPLAVRQRVEIARALMKDASIVLFDEPNSALTDEESAALFTSMHELAETGCVVILVSHRLAEVVRHCRRVVVIRDGSVACDLDAATEDQIARELVVGHRRAGMSVEATRSVTASAGLDVVAPGCITALMGVEGSGAREILVGLWEGSPGRVVQYVPADRRDSLFANLSVGENCVMRLSTDRIAVKWGIIRRAAATAAAESSIIKFGVKSHGPAQDIIALSGGNQQKVALAAALAAEPMTLIIEEPTRGVDVGSKADIYAILRDAAASGLAVVLLCTEVPEAFDVADRVLVVDAGKIVTELLVGGHPDVGSLAAAVAVPEHTQRSSTEMTEGIERT